MISRKSINIQANAVKRNRKMKHHQHVQLCKKIANPMKNSETLSLTVCAESSDGSGVTQSKTCRSLSWQQGDRNREAFFLDAFNFEELLK